MNKKIIFVENGNSMDTQADIEWIHKELENVKDKMLHSYLVGK